MTTFWVNENNLDDEQKSAAKGIPLDASFLLTGPAGSGKTNVLLLRAKWLKLKSLSNFKVIVFTSSLKQFVRMGAQQYGLPTEDIVTANQLFRSILSEYHKTFESTGNFEEDRALLAGQVKSLLESKNVSNVYEALLIDEAQDYTDTELLVMRRLTPRLMLACDSRQSIYKVTNSPEALALLVSNNVVTLKYHYRTGLKLCTVADAILKDSQNFPPMRGECKYDEATRPSSLELSQLPTFSDQIRAILIKIPKQIELYPGALIGVIFPKREQQSEFQAALDADHTIPDKSKIWVDTIHGAKGWEFQVTHIGGCESLSRMGGVQKRLIYTGILRARTAVHLYCSGHIPGYLDSALATISAPKEDPGWGEMFGA